MPLTRRLELPTQRFVSEAALAGSGNGPALAVWGGAADEPPEGPNGFGVLSDGSVIVTDPLAKRLVVFDGRGQFLRAVALGFAADSVRVDQADAVVVREATTGALHPVEAFNGVRRDGDKVAGEGAGLVAEARLLSARRGEVLLGGRQGGAESKLTVEISDQGATLLSIEYLDRGAAGDVFVAIELTSEASAEEGISLRKDVRRYSAAGQVLGEVVGLPLNYFVAPVDELRVRSGNLYQLMTTASSVAINIWAMQ